MRLMEDNGKKKETKGIQWHPAFVVALQALLIDYSDVLEYRLEHPLTTGALRLDVLVVKKRPDAVVKRQIAEIFRRHNIMEYKSPTDNLSVNEFYKSFGRACIYKALDDVEIADLTLSFVVASRPRELFRHLRGWFGCTVNETHPGVFVVAGTIMPIQIIDIRKLSDEENLWLRNLDRNLSEKNLLWAHGMKKKHGARLDLNAWLQAVFAANHKAIEGIISKEGNSMLTAEFCETIEKIGLGAKWRQEGIEKGIEEGIEKGIEKGKLDAARAMLSEGLNMEVISRVTKIPIKTLKKKLSLQ